MEHQYSSPSNLPLTRPIPHRATAFLLIWISIPLLGIMLLVGLVIGIQVGRLDVVGNRSMVDRSDFFANSSFQPQY